MRAPTTTRGKLDSCMPGAIAMESSSSKASGSSRTLARFTASGIGGPCAGRDERARLLDARANGARVFRLLRDERQHALPVGRRAAVVLALECRGAGERQ